MLKKSSLALTFFALVLLAGSSWAGPAKAPPLKFGTLPTEDALPLWAAEKEGLFAKAGLDFEIITFQSAQERDVAFSSGAIDAFMGDLIAAALLQSSGVGVSVATVMLGASPAEGRFGIVAAPGSGIADLRSLAGVPVGTSSGTIQEYVLDGLMRQAGVTDVRKEEVKKVPVRFELLMSGKLKAAALPEPLLSLAEKQGAKLLADDTKGENLTQTVLVLSKRYLAKNGGSEGAKMLLEVWDRGVEAVNRDPNAWRGTLVEKARLPKPIQDTYRVNHYPKSQLPTRAEVESVLTWMRAKGLLKSHLAYEDLCPSPGR